MEGLSRGVEGRGVVEGAGLPLPGPSLPLPGPSLSADPWTSDDSPGPPTGSERCEHEPLV